LDLAHEAFEHEVLVLHLGGERGRLEHALAVPAAYQRKHVFRGAQKFELALAFDDGAALAEVQRLKSDVERGKKQRTEAPRPVESKPEEKREQAPVQRVIRELSEAEKEKMQRLEQQAGSGRTGALAKIFMPSLLSAYKSKLKGAQELALLVAKLQRIAEGKEKPAELRNAALLLARASAGARSVPDDAQDSIELMRVAHTALQDADAARAAEILLRSDRSVMQPLAQAIVCKRCDFAVLRHPIPTFDVRLLGGLRGATRMALADGLRHVRERTDAAAIVPAAVTAYRVAALQAMDPSLPRAAVSHSIWREATAAVQEAAKFGPIGKEGADELERALATMGSADPFGFRKGAEEDAKRLVSNATARRDATAKEAIAERAKVLKQRGPGAVWAYMAFVAIGRNKDPMPSAKDAGLVRLTDIYPQVSLDAITAAVAQAAGTERADDVPFDLPVDEQKARLRRLDPVRGVKFIDASTMMANGGADYMAAFDAVKAAASAASPAAAQPGTK
jgi:hypothetical protein